MELNVKDMGVMQVSELTFDAKYNEPLIHQAVVAFLAAGRQGTHAQKSRSEVRGGGRKPWRQKGTGRARAGTIRSPIWRGGGKAFAAKPRDYSQKLNKKMYRSALRSILSELVRQDRLIVVAQFDVEAPKTKIMLGKLKEFNAENSLIVADEINLDVYLASRNLPHVDVCDVQAINPVSLIEHDIVIMTKNAINKIEEVLG